MRTLILSDTHLTGAFNRRKCTFLRSIIAPADRVVINGDFWDSYLTIFDRFVASPWRELFPLLRARRAIYLYGNHDPQEASDERFGQFSVQQRDDYVLPLRHFHIRCGRSDVELGELVIQHGHRIVPHVDSRFEWLARIPAVALLGAAAESVLVRRFGRAYLRLHRRDNDRMREWAASNLGPNQILVTGHNHLAEFDLTHRYICTGFIRYGWASYLVIEDEKLELVQTNY